LNILVSSASYLFTDHAISSEGMMAYEICKRLAARGHRIFVLAPEVLVRSPIPRAHIFELGPRGIQPLTDPVQEVVKWWLFAIKSRLKTKEILKSEHIDILHHFSPSWPGSFSPVLDLHKPFIFGPIPLPSVRTLPSAIAPLRRIYKNFTYFLHELTLKRADKILVQLDSMKKLILPSADFMESKIETVPMGVDTKIFRPAGKEDDGNIILFVGGLYRMKGLEFLLRAMPIVKAEVPDARLIVVGDGPDRLFLQTVIREVGCSDCASFVGFVPHSNIARHFQYATVFCLPSLSEAFGVSILEAMASGKPIVATNVGGIAQVVQHGGILVPPRNSKALASALITLLKDNGLRKKMGKYGRQLTERKFDYEIITTKIETIYKRSLYETYQTAF